MNRTDNPRYCKYHLIVSHLVEKCFVLKDLIMKLAQERVINLCLDDVVESNHTAVTFGSFDFTSLPRLSEVEGLTHVTPEKTTQEAYALSTS
ncbi:hypothetical protein TB2_040271 [Malus domestica]